MRNRFAVVCALLCVVAAAAGLAAPEPAPIRLPAPAMTGGAPLMYALKLRETSREFAPDALPLQTLANLLWATWGINRPASGKRTAPSAHNWQEVDVYAVMASGAYLYDPAANTLRPVAGGDLRALAGTQAFVKEAPLTLVFVADTARMKGAPADMRQTYAWADSAFLSENTYLFCASDGLATGVRAMVDRPPLAKALNLKPSQIITLAQCVGMPKKK
jgi:nitroreductase